MTPIDTPQLLAATLIAGIMIGFVVSCLWEWLYFRKRRAERIDQAVAAAVADARATYTQNSPPPGPAPSENAYSSEDYYDEQSALLDYETEAFRQGAAVAVSRQPTAPGAPPQTGAVQPAPANYAALAAATGAAVATVAAVAGGGQDEEPPPLRTTAATKSGAKTQTSAQDLFNYELSAYREVTTPPPLVEKPPPNAQATPPVQSDPSAMAPLIAAGAVAAIARHVHDGHEPAAETADPGEPIAEPPSSTGGDPRSNPNAGIPQADETTVPITQPALPTTASTTVDQLPGTQGGATLPGKAPATAATPAGLPATAHNTLGTTLPATTESVVTAAPTVSQAQPEPAPAPDRTKARIAATAAAVAAVAKAVTPDEKAPKTQPPGTPDEAPLLPGGPAAAGVAPVTNSQPDAGRESATAHAVATPIAAQAPANDQEPIDDDEALWSDDEAPEPALAANEPEAPEDDEALWSDADPAPESPLAAGEPEAPEDDEALWSDADPAPESPLAASEPEAPEDDEVLWSDADPAPEPVNDYTASPTAARGGEVDSAPQDTGATPSTGETPHAHKARKAAAAAEISHATRAPSAGESASRSPAPQAQVPSAPDAPASSATAGATPQPPAQPAPAPGSDAAVPPTPNANQTELPSSVETGATVQASTPQIAAPAAEAVHAPSTNAPTSEDDASRPGVTAAILAAGGAAVAGLRKALRSAETAPQAATAKPVPNSPEAYQNGVSPIDNAEPVTEPEVNEVPKAVSTNDQPITPEKVDDVQGEVAPVSEQSRMPALAAAALTAAQSADGSQGQELPTNASGPDAARERTDVIPPGEEANATPEEIDGTYTARNLSRTEYAVVRLMQQSRLTYGEITRLFQRKPAPALSQADDLTRIPTLTVAHAERLQMAGVTSYRKLAGLSQQELEMLFLVPTGDPNPDFSVWLVAARGLA